LLVNIAMAILDSVPGLAVHVCVDGTPLEEYKDGAEEEVEELNTSVIKQYQAARTVCQYVESVSDKEFSIELLVQPTYEMDCDNLEIGIKIDGKTLITPIISKKDLYHLFRLQFQADP